MRIEVFFMGSALKRNYHWIVAATVFMEMFIVGGVLNVMSSLFLIPVTDALSISRGVFGLAISAKSMSALFSNLLAGILFTRLGYRKLTPLFVLLFALGLFLLATVQSTPMLFAACLLMGICEGFISVGACARVIGAWFHKKHGLVMGAVTSATGLGGSLYSLILSALITSYGFEGAAIFCVVSVAASGLLLLFLVKSKPQDMGLVPYGEGHNHGLKAAEHHWMGYTTGQMLRSPVFYLLTLGTFLSCACASPFSTILTPHLQDCGMDAMAAAGVLSLLYILLAATKFLIGTLSDRIGPAKACMICIGICPIALTLMALVQGSVSAYITIALASVALPITALVAPLLVPYVLGFRSSSLGNGIMLAVAAAGTMLSSIAANYMHDAFGSYRLFYWIAAGISTLVVFIYLLMFKLSRRDHEKC